MFRNENYIVMIRAKLEIKNWSNYDDCETTDTIEVIPDENVDDRFELRTNEYGGITMRTEDVRELIKILQLMIS
jgi:hypothetical protein